MKNVEQYAPQFFPVKNPPMRWAQKTMIWCSVDLRDGNQALITPMSLDEKLEFFRYLVKIGFKEIEIGFPAASETEYEFCRTLIENNMIPDDVTIQVLTQAREHIIAKTFEALKGAKHAIVHLYNSTSVAQREQVFKKSKTSSSWRNWGQISARNIGQRPRDTSGLSILRKALPAPNRNSLWRSATPY